jgi:polyhydroxybutyrate depolymerase
MPTEQTAGASSTPVVLEQESGSCSGRPGKLRGKSRHTIRAANGMRSFVYYVPKTLDPNTPAPVVIAPHGYTMSGEQMFGITGYAQLADREGFIAIFPDGGVGAGPWNVGLGICGNGTFVNGINNDQAFVDAMIDFAAQDRCVDRDHVFMNGFSMGGYFSNETGCVNPKIKGIAPHSGGTHDLGRCIDRPLPVLIQHFNPDTLISYNCGVEARNKWARRNGCELANPEVEQIKGGRCEYYKGCREGGQVAMCTFNEPLLGGGEMLRGHGWAGGFKAGGGDLFSIPGPANASELSWNFFKKYAW